MLSYPYFSFATTTATAIRTAKSNSRFILAVCQQNNNFARASRCFAHFLAVVARLRNECDMKLANFTRSLCGVGIDKTKKFS